MLRPLHRVACLALALAALTGCEAIVNFDRSKIPDGAVVDSGVDMGRDFGPHDLGTPDLGLCTTAASCDDSDACTTDVCDTGTSMCTHTDIADCCTVDADCDDAMFCTTDSCDMTMHRCLHPAMTDCCDTVAMCDDGVACTTDACDATGHMCMHTPIASCCTAPADCMDTNACTVDTCDVPSGTCMNVAPTGCCLTAGDCGDSDTCTTDTCDGTMACMHVAIPGCCTTAATCDDGNPCTDDGCDTGTSLCTHTDNSATCTGGVCSGGACCTGCVDGTGCHAGTADVVCGSAGTACSDCTASGQTCSSGSCASPPPTCSVYCTAIMANCTGANAQYGALANCMNACANFGWALGSAGGSDSGDTLGCRQYHAGAAAGDPVLHCPHAGPDGAGVCGPGNCASWCAANAAVCGTAAYADVATCMTTCTGWPDSAAPNLSLTDMQFNCRTYHLTAAAAPGGAGGHCPHTTVGGGGVCPP